MFQDVCRSFLVIVDIAPRRGDLFRVFGQIVQDISRKLYQFRALRTQGLLADLHRCLFHAAVIRSGFGETLA